MPTLPSSYTELPYTQIRLSHVPDTSPTPTPVVLVTLYRPDNHNAFTNTMMTELESAFGLFDADDRVKCIVVTGHGRFFCAGADLSNNTLAGGLEKPEEHRDGGGRVGGLSISEHSVRYRPHQLAPGSDKDR